ncbi:hypothetical protein PR202_ga15319 [Eleusine coracana subsp. coracana]|uniref:Secreted protein n=1 Tax=Eleusine coracana subsp. coracana TaxID=191504 RepID=A0AAV5CJW0_ELECO|nr:hypothetical protein PR202_ga15319 [Eleusine coracana subsp. coracana]
MLTWWVASFLCSAGTARRYSCMTQAVRDDGSPRWKASAVLTPTRNRLPPQPEPCRNTGFAFPVAFQYPLQLSSCGRLHQSPALLAAD